MNAKHIAENGIIVALTIVILYAATFLPISKLSVLTVASCLIPISIIRTSIKNTILVYLASSILSFFLIAANIALYYSLFFGIYGIIKYFVEKLNRVSVEILLKLISFNILLSIIYFISMNFFGDLNFNFPLYLIWLIGQGVFLIYDYALAVIISYYLKRIHKFI